MTVAGVLPVGVRHLRPPGPRGSWWAGNLADYEADRLGFLLTARDQYGGLVTFDRVTTLGNDADLAIEVLRGPEFAIKGNFLNERLGALEVAEVRAARRHLNPGLRAAAVQSIGPLAAKRAATAVRRAVLGSRRLDPVPVLERVFSGLVAEYYFGSDGPVVGDAVSRLSSALSRVFGNPLSLPSWVPAPTNLRVGRRYREVRAIVDPLIRRRRRQDAGSDFVSLIARSSAKQGVDEERVAHLVIGSMLAAQLVPAAGAAWTLMYLTDRRLVERVRSGAVPIGAVITEALRLHPPTWTIRRTTLRPVELGGYRFPAGHGVLVSPYVVHRDPQLFERPFDFVPERWLGGRRVQGRGLLTFGGGSHICPGRDLAMIALSAALTEILDRYDLGASWQHVASDPSTTLLPEGLLIRFEARTDHGQALDASELERSTR